MVESAEGEYLGSAAVFRVDLEDLLRKEGSGSDCSVSVIVERSRCCNFLFVIVM